ncbi:MAG: LysR family transcriptional regulator [Modestobacter sp.]|jgi:DNA-binding transcriptional LysR family regulator|nr:LysR family transcriptional regulator [Modestobacter sp.]HEV7726966.1 LysR family transcriptional regulator [Modestobacter sp.]
MELRTLSTFVTVAELGSVSAAAVAVRVTQPALSRQIRQLERELTVPLFDRHGGRLRLSSAGRHLLPMARSVLDQARATTSAAEALAAGRLVSLAMAAPTTTLTDVIAPFLATLQPTDPATTVVEIGAAGALDALRTGVDLAVITTPPPNPWAWRTLAVLPLWAYVPRGHRLADRDDVGLAELVREPLVLLADTFRPRQILNEALATDALPSPQVIECSNAQVAQALAAAGRGVAVVSDDPRFDLHGLRVRSSAGHLHITLHAAWDPAHHASGTLASIAERLAAFCADRYPAAGPHAARTAEVDD